MQTFSSLLSRFMREKSPQYFWPLFTVLTLVFLVTFLDHFRSYEAESNFMVALSGETETQEALSLATEEVAQLPLSIDFYDQLLAFYPEVKDPWADLLTPNREDAWHEHIRTEASEESGTFTVSIAADSAADAVALSDRIAGTLYRVMSRSYDIRTQANIQRLGNPTVTTTMDSVMGWISISLGLGALLAFILSSLLGRISFSGSSEPSAQGDLSERIQNMLKPRDDDYKAVKQQLPFEMVPQTPPTAEKEAAQEEPVTQSPKIKAKKPVAEIRSAAPSNLPFLADGVSLEQYLFQNTDSENASATDVKLEDTVKPDAQAENTENPIQSQEPTEEELKRRLNQLLRGEL